MIDRLTAEDLDIVIGTRFGDGTPDRMPKLKRLLLPVVAKLSPASRKLGLTDAHNGLRVFDRTVADGLNLTMNGMAHASEIRHADRREPVAGGRGTRRNPLHRLLDVEGATPRQRRQHHLRRPAARKDAPMNWIQVLLIAAIVVLLVYLLRSRRSAKSRAWVKLGYVLFVIGAIYAVIRPNDTTVVANWLGVDRGADLIEYALVIAFLFTTLSAYMRFKDLELRYAQLARAVALEGARAPDER